MADWNGPFEKVWQPTLKGVPMSVLEGSVHAASEKNVVVEQVPLMMRSTEAMARGNEMQVPLAASMPVVVEMRVLLDAQNPEVNTETEKVPAADTVAAETIATTRMAGINFMLIICEYISEL